MAAFASLFGDELQGKSGNVATSAALAGKAGVMVYFSAHWCPPCRGFTPQLADFYKKHAEAKNFEIVFASSDSDKPAFDEYFAEQPWLALPFEKRELKETLSKKYKVQGIPTLIVLGPEGDLITKDGRSEVMQNKDTCAGFPWKPQTLAEVLEGSMFLRQDGSHAGKDAIAGKTLGLYFSAHWCPPCRGFTPMLKEFYEAYKKKDPNFEIVFVSSDKDEAQMLDYFKNDHGSYLALPFAKRAEKESLSKIFGVEGIPTFAVCGANGKIINANARSKISAGVDAVLADGWTPPSVGNLAEGADIGGTDINECPTVVIMCEGCSSTDQQSIFDALKPLGKKYIDEAESSGEDPKYIFFIAKGGGPMDQLKDLIQNAGGDVIKAAGSKPIMVLMDIPDDGGFYISSTHEITTSSVEAFIKSKEAGNETRMHLGR